ncbi:RNA-guided endonuclease InsQ/TnpB family protein [Paralcaligenes ureilyticus]|uniref:Putative transposase n=1 Tax=Paralcaligenes ureilyticus TaxID=627131 RepID=A0A4R3M6J0_9BURK|nr:RNA-guided endonuclease TnpB family protein [Paralcaligenes ureilyticus]TCT09031.1 putative transposase [Paralcaligenes ureilyticus]
MFLAQRYALRLKPAQEALLRRWSGGARWLWNQALACQHERYAQGLPYANYIEMAKWLTEWRHAPATAWLSENPVHVQQSVLKRLDEAYRRFFARCKEAKAPASSGATRKRRNKVGPPRFKRRGQEPGLRFPDKAQIHYDAANGRLKLSKIGFVRLRHSKVVPGAIANAALTREGNKWFVSVQYSVPDVTPLGLPPEAGADAGVKVLCTMSNGVMHAALNALKKQAGRIKHQQRAVSRKTKGSKNRRKAVNRLGALHRQAARQRKDWLHKLSTLLANTYSTIAIEDLHVASMSASARGTVEAPGKNVKAKAGLNRSILDQSWAMFWGFLDYKLRAKGGELIRVNPAFTSQRCYVCDHTEKANRPTQSQFRCVACGHTDHADVNAAKNILAAGHAVWLTRKGQSLPVEGMSDVAELLGPQFSMKQELSQTRPC